MGYGPRPLEAIPIQEVKYDLITSTRVLVHRESMSGTRLQVYFDFASGGIRRIDRRLIPIAAVAILSLVSGLSLI